MNANSNIVISSLLPLVAGGVTLDGAVDSAILANRSGAQYKVVGEELKGHKIALSAYLYGTLQSVSRANRESAIEAFANACEATGDLADNWRKSSSLATKISEAKRIAKTLATADYLTCDSFSTALSRAREITKEREAEADAIVAEREAVARAKDTYGADWEYKLLEERAAVIVEKLKESFGTLSSNNQDTLCSIIRSTLYV